MQQGAGLGALLRKCREGKGLSLEGLSRATRIVPRHLLALEEDRLRDLPAPVFVRGFIRAYCTVVSEPPEGALGMYETWVAATGPPRGRIPPTALAPPRRAPAPWWRALASPLVAAGVLVVVGGAVYLLTSSAASRATARPRQPGPPGSPAALPDSRAAVPAAGPAVTPAAIARTPAVPAAAGITGHVLVARVHEQTWVSVQPEDGVGSRELLQPGTTRAWRGARWFTVTLGNAGGVSLELDGVALPSLGRRGQVVRELRLPREARP